MQTVDVTAYAREPALGHTSKGNQPKWHIKGIWYKADHMGYEGLSEILVSRLLAKSNVTDFVTYAPARMINGDKTMIGCASKNFRAANEMLVPLERLHRTFNGIGLASKLATFSETEDAIAYTVEFVEKVTGLERFGQHLSLQIEIDAFFLNEDRHTNNLAVIRNEATKAFRFCPYFDNGLALLSDTSDYPLRHDLYACIDQVKAKPFHRDIAAQLTAITDLYGSHLEFYFTKQDVRNVLSELASIYSPEILSRAQSVLYEQMRKHSHLFRG